MQSLLFVFIGLPDNHSNVNLSLLMKSLNEKFEKKKIDVSFSQRDELLLARFGEVGFYISFLKTKDELKDWKQMATDFELKFYNNPINKTQLLNRYSAIIESSSNPYEEIHFAIGINILEEMEKFSGLTIYSFQ